MTPRDQRYLEFYATYSNEIPTASPYVFGVNEANAAMSDVARDRPTPEINTAATKPEVNL